MTISTLGLVALASMATVGGGHTPVADHDAAAHGSIAPLHIAAGEQVAGEYIVVLKDDPAVTSEDDSAMDAVADVATAHGGTVHDRLTALNMITATLNDTALQQVRQDPAVAYVETNTVMSIDPQHEGTTGEPAEVDHTADALNNIHPDAFDSGLKTGHNEVINHELFEFSSADTGHPSDTFSPTSDLVTGMNWVAVTGQGPSAVNLNLAGTDTPALDDAAAAISDTSSSHGQTGSVKSSG